MDERETFDLAVIRPGWRGRLILALRAQLERGYAAVRSELDGAPFAICTLVSEFDHDGAWDSIAGIAAAADAQAARAEASAIHEHSVSGLLAGHSDWTVLRDTASPLRLLPGTRLPDPLIASRLGCSSPTDFAYVRTYLLDRAEAGDPLESLLNALPLEQEFVAYFTKLGS